MNLKLKFQYYGFLALAKKNVLSDLMFTNSLVVKSGLGKKLKADDVL